MVQNEQFVVPSVLKGLRRFEATWNLLQELCENQTLFSAFPFL